MVRFKLCSKHQRLSSMTHSFNSARTRFRTSLVGFGVRLAPKSSSHMSPGEEEKDVKQLHQATSLLYRPAPRMVSLSCTFMQQFFLKPPSCPVTAIIKSDTLLGATNQIGNYFAADAAPAIVLHYLRCLSIHRESRDVTCGTTGIAKDRPVKGGPSFGVGEITHMRLGFIMANTRPSVNVDDILRGLEKVRRSGHGWLACCPAHGDTSPSLSISVGDKGVIWKCHAGCSQEDVGKALGVWGTDGCIPIGNGYACRVKRVSKEKPNKKNVDRIAKLWSETQAVITGDPVYKYIVDKRHLRLAPWPDDIRYHPEMPYWVKGKDEWVKFAPYACMVAAIRDENHNIVSLHRTYLSPDGEKTAPTFDGEQLKSKLLMPSPYPGATKGAAIKLSFGHPTPTHIVVGEGIETALAALHLLGGHTAWATINSNNLGEVILPKKYTHITICVDNDDAGRKAAGRLASRYRRRTTVEFAFAGKVIDKPGADWADILMKDNDNE